MITTRDKLLQAQADGHFHLHHTSCYTSPGIDTRVIPYTGRFGRGFTATHEGKTEYWIRVQQPTRAQLLQLRGQGMVTLHHVSQASGYVTRKPRADTEIPSRTYTGRFGRGYTVAMAHDRSNRYHYREYWILTKVGMLAWPLFSAR